MELGVAGLLAFLRLFALLLLLFTERFTFWLIVWLFRWRGRLGVWTITAADAHRNVVVAILFCPCRRFLTSLAPLYAFSRITSEFLQNELFMRLGQICNVFLVPALKFIMFVQGLHLHALGENFVTLTTITTLDPLLDSILDCYALFNYCYTWFRSICYGLCVFKNIVFALIFAIVISWWTTITLIV